MTVLGLKFFDPSSEHLMISSVNPHETNAHTAADT
jgi:hypothetical protein